ncbi:membrane-bound mettalopeptidase, putative [Candida dubliniensis CD36]|uniref:Vacuolar membrane protease n=1 Tax=Candida dubliniensis (strain CD36 / ATCC MYA-646 / CBS 7987 / NCPF 3949 / NRRL Y-17841) TaxID=573826 RepID=PFF1_CANDC|nr:membrane-bound mettalopeptidase, putative [Candida dubliniensis CD36]B9WCV6.1 RecName: Full=Vacuolar membrane protease; AltName: Full=FXNA-related family protease 1 [Candida dubliniensis CD36]CAX44231.1 membrane-bound mettalopeptidase, putative [Candida dubliniensis CD36]
MPQEEVHDTSSVSDDNLTNTGGGGSNYYNSHNQPNVFVRAIRSIFGYRKTSLTLFVILTIIFTIALSLYDNNLDLTIELPTNKLENEILKSSWLDLQNIARYPHTYGSRANDRVHDYLESRIHDIIKENPYTEYNNDGEKVLYESAKSIVSYYESNNLLVRINGSDASLPALLLSAHYDSVPSSFGVTDDGMGIASLLGVLRFFAQNEQPRRTVIFNFNNDEEFGLYGAQAFVSHPWFKQIGFFLNLEGTGAGGKAILFRGTDYGIVKYFNKVRYPYATSIFQQGFNNHLIHSETDYKVYKEAGLRGLDLAFYKPRDIYHTAEDNIKNINLKSLWHMLSNSIDFANFVSNQKINDSGKDEFAVYTSFLGYFFSSPISALVTINSVLIVLFPILSGPLLFITVRYKKWKIGTSNFLSLPLAIVLTVAIVMIVVNQGFQIANPFLPSSHPLLLVATTTSISLLIYYVFLNGVNWVSPSGDQKLITIIEISFIYWLILIYVTHGLSQNKIGDDHTGEFPFTVLFFLEATASLFGLIGWTFSRSIKQSSNDGSDEPLLTGTAERYGSDDTDEDEQEEFRHHDGNTVKHLMQHFGYDWSLQYLLIVPISSLIIFNSGWLVLDGINKSIQESFAAENLIYLLIQLFSQFWILPILPFVYKLNRFIVFGLTIFAISGVALISFLDPFNQENPLKLRFIQKVDLNKSQDSFVEVYGRKGIFSDILSDMPSVKETHTKVECEALSDGLEACSYKSALAPNVIPGKSLKDYVNVEIVNSSKIESYGLLSGEIIITAPENRMCTLYFTKKKVKAVVIYNKSKSVNNFKSIPDGFSRDSKGNYIYKDVAGIDQLVLNKLDWNKNYHIGFDWLPNIDDEVNTLSVDVECYWADLAPGIGGGDNATNAELAIPAYNELVHYSPNWVTWANREKGLVSVSLKIEV